MAKGARPRRIVVDGRAFRWRVRTTPEIYPGEVVVAVWAEAAGGRGQRLEVAARFDDPWRNYGPMITTPRERFAAVWRVEPVTPSRVATWVRAAIMRGWDPAARGAPRRFGEAEL